VQSLAPIDAKRSIPSISIAITITGLQFTRRMAFSAPELELIITSSDYNLISNCSFVFGLGMHAASYIWKSCKMSNLFNIERHGLMTKASIFLCRKINCLIKKILNYKLVSLHFREKKKKKSSNMSQTPNVFFFKRV
jgi:hypothetical protein